MTLGQRAMATAWWTAFAATGAALGTISVVITGRPVLLVASGVWTALSLAVAGTVVLQRTDARALGVVLCWCAGWFGVVQAADPVSQMWSGPAPAVADLLSAAGFPLFVVPSITLLPLLFPDGRLPSPRWRWVAWVAVAAVALLALGSAMEAGLGPPGLSERLGEVINTLGLAAWTLSGVAAVVSLVARWWRGDRRRRLQLGLITVVLVVVTATYLLEPWLPSVVSTVVANAWVPVLVLTMAYAVLAHQLWDVDLALRRAEVYALLMGVLLLVYLAALLFLGRLLQGLADGWVVLIATGVVLVVAEPARRWCRRAMVRRLYGDRDDPLAALVRLRESVERSSGDEVLQGVAEGTVRALRSPGARVLIHRGEGLMVGAEAGSFGGDDPLRVPLVQVGEEVGVLEMAARGRGESWTPGDLRLLDLLAHEAAATVALVRSRSEQEAARVRDRQQTVDGRARLGRELHDSLGPALAGSYLAAQGLSLRLGSDTEEGGSAARIADGLARASSEVRRMIDGLEPGVHTRDLLVQTLEEHLSTLERPAMTLEARVGELPPAVANAAFLIALEAVTNVARHAHASSAHVELDDRSGRLTVRVIDDGRLGTWVAGVGVRSMRQRAGELGGTWAMHTLPTGGTELVATLPLEEDADD